MSKAEKAEVIIKKAQEALNVGNVLRGHDLEWVIELLQSAVWIDDVGEGPKEVN